MSDEHKAAVEKVNERNTVSLLAMIEKLESRVAELEAQTDLLSEYIGGTQTAMATLSDQVMSLLVWRATEEQNRGDDD